MSVDRRCCICYQLPQLGVYPRRMGNNVKTKRSTVPAILAAMVALVAFATACKESPAEFVVSDLAINPNPAEVWEQVVVTAKVSNIGDKGGTYAATLRLDGSETETTQIAVDGGETETVSFTFVRDDGPSVNVEVGGEAGTLAITEGVLPALSIGDTWVSKFLSDGIEYIVTEEVTGEDSSGPHHQDSGEAKIRESTAGVSRKPSSDCKACGCSSKHLCGLTAWNT